MADSLLVHYRNPNHAATISTCMLDDAATIFSWTRGQPLGGRRVRSLRRDIIDGLGAVYIKRYEFPRARMSGRFIGSEAYREWINSMRMLQIGIGQPEPILVATRCNRWGVTGSYLITCEVPRARSLDSLLQEPAGQAPTYPLDGLADSIIETIQQMHAAGFCHWDLKPRNILVALSESGFGIIPIDSVNGRSIGLWNRSHCTARDYRFLLQDPHIGPLMAAKLGISIKRNA